METFIAERIKEVKKGNVQAFEDVVSFYQNKVYFVCFRMIGNSQEAEDLAQEAFIRAYTNIESFDEKRKFSTWLYRIATNLTIDRIRKKKPDYHLDADIKGTDGLSMHDQLATDEALPEEQVENLELRGYIQREITALPPIYRSVIVLRFLEELSLQEIAEVLDMPVGTVKTRIHRGREILRKKLRNV
ncbi:MULTISPECIES: RNA polymerase sigma factor SigW [Salimicrobium]|uniref:RNA polymerase sigma factor n=4 Tax=Salimicrobium TaxID=351195 RepID=K2FIX4_9BACI|nr:MULTISPECIES: RNA polymerase sigma factor SigW [Salimicrobium]AKG05487.1 RNA polymerase sigma factor SigW [Salimicrobium jeotgali]EKE31046.1 RNA polymerase sigma factor SigW [Salimicrobium jeotgali]MBM7697397.1 RNA polymerase sigma-70 factor (ECF subfamily) [Salimicrobium jeotgali]PBB05949.1 RNA polymerase sigma factor SigW [Salimicrobium humidisoli]SDY19277.1 RNA polymerase sigma-70 factor, ECF subfamily [Salimicrobium album]